MNRFSTRSTDKPKRLRLLCLCAAFWSVMGLSCVSQPKPPTLDAPQAAAEPAPPAAPEVVGLSRPRVTAAPARAALAEPELRPPVPAAPQPRPPVDITVLSASPTITFAPVRLPEPSAPVAAAKPAAAATTPALPTATPSKPATSPAAPPAAKPAATATPAAPKASTPAAKPDAGSAAAATTPAPQPSQTAVLPAAPTSSARVEAAARPVAETKMETARGERFELRFPGSGWIYLGDEQGKEGLRYETRRFEDNAAVFAMNPDQVGEYLLRFQRQNPVDRSTEVSLVRVTVVDKPSFSATPSSAVSAPAAAAGPVMPAASPVTAAAGAQPQSAAQPTTQPSAQGASPMAAQPASPGIDLQSITDPSELIKRARDELDAKRVQTAIDALDRYLSLYPYGTDEVYYLYGLAYEQDTPFRNIKKSYDAYKRVRDEYPRSSRWKDAAEKMAYFEKHYLGLR